MALITSKSKVMAAKLESTFNVAPVLANVDTFEIKSSSSITATLDTVERDVIRNSMLGLAPIPVRENASGNMDFELIPLGGSTDALLGDVFWEAGMGLKKASGVAGSGAFIGFSDAGVTAADEIYLAAVAETGTATAYILGGVTDPTKSITVKEFVGTNKSMTTTGNVVESITLNLPTADVANVSFSLSGCGFLANEADTKLVPSCVNTLPYLGKSAVFKFDGSTVNATDVSVTISNEIYSEESLASDGYSSKVITGKTVTGSFTVLFEDYSLLTKFQNSQDGELYIQLTQGTSKFAVYMPMLRLTSFAKSDSNGVQSVSVDFQVPSTCVAGVQPIIVANFTA